MLPTREDGLGEGYHNQLRAVLIIRPYLKKLSLEVILGMEDILC